MDGNYGPEGKVQDELRSMMAMCDRALEEVTLPEGKAPMASEAADRLLLAVNNVIALRDT